MKQAQQLEKYNSTTNNPTNHQGYMTKRGQKRKTWKRRYFVLKQHHLSYFTNQSAHEEGQQQPKGIIDLSAGSVVPKTVAFASREFSFEISTPSRTLLVYCDTKMDMIKWIQCIQTAAIEATDPLFIRDNNNSNDNTTNTTTLPVVANKLNSLNVFVEDVNVPEEEEAVVRETNTEEDKGDKGEDSKEIKRAAEETTAQLKLAEGEEARRAVAAAVEEVRLEQVRLAAEKEEAAHVEKEMKEIAAKAKEEEEEAARVVAEIAAKAKREAEAKAKADADAEAKAAKAEAESQRKIAERQRLLKEDLTKKACDGFLCMKKAVSEVQFRSPRYVWCNRDVEPARICWSKGRERNLKKMKFITVDDVVSITPLIINNKKKVKRGSVFAGTFSGSSSELVDMISKDAVLTITHKKGDKQSINLHLSPSASKSRVEGTILKRRNEKISWLAAFVEVCSSEGSSSSMHSSSSSSNNNYSGETKTAV